MRNSKIILYILAIVLMDSTIYAQTKRDVAFCHGTGATSLGWNQLDAWLSTNWNYSNIINGSYSTLNGIDGVASFIDHRIIDRNASNVLGIAHGFGGLGLRQAQLGNPAISAMVLNGVPNQGSRMIYELSSPGGGEESNIKKLIKDIQAITGANNCPGCDGLSNWNTWATAFEKNTASWIQMGTNEDFFVDYGAPTVPYIVMYGLINPNSYGHFTTSFMDSRTGSSSNILRDCYDQQIKDAEKKLKFDIQKSTLKSVSNWFAGLLSAVGEFVKSSGESPNPASILKYASDIIKTSTERIISQLEIQFNEEKETARILRCRLAHQVLEANWFLLMGPGDIEEITVEVIDEIDYFGLQQCNYGCDLTYQNDPASLFICYTDCNNYYVGGSTTISFYTFIPEPSDGLFRQSEMQLPGGMQVGGDIVLSGVDHFGETLPQNVHTVFSDQIFSGSLGAAFAVPPK